MSFLDTCLTILDIAERATKLYDWFTGVSSGNQMKTTLNELAQKKAPVERLSDRMLYAADYQQAVNKDSTQRFNDKKRIHDMMAPIASSMDTDLLVSAVMATPDKLRQAFRKDPWELLIDARPANRAKKQNNPDLVPIGFYENNVHYIGWQTRGALPSLFSCDFESNGTLLLPSKTVEGTGPAFNGQDDLLKERFIEDLVDWLGFHDDKPGLHLAPKIPKLKLMYAAENRHMQTPESILALIDCTTDKTAKEYLAFGTKGIYYRNTSQTEQPGSHFIPYVEFRHRTFSKPWFFEVSLGRKNSLNTAGCQMSRSDILAILNGITKVVVKHKATVEKMV